MASWPTGIDEIQRLLNAGNLQKVTPTLDASIELLRAAERHLASALVITENDPDSACSTTLPARASRRYSSRKASARQAAADTSPSKMAIRAQFSKPPPRDAFRPFGRLRRTRNRVEYDNISAITVDDVRADLATVQDIHRVATELINILPVFAD